MPNKNEVLQEGSRVPDVVFIVREGDTAVCGDKSGHWSGFSTTDIFGGKRIVAFALPGAYTPTCSSTHLPGYNSHYDAIKAFGIDEIYCISVNDAFVMHNWALALGVARVKMLPDGNGDFSRGMGMLVKKENLGFGERSWRYSMLVENGIIKKIFAEPGMQDNAEGDPFETSGADVMMKYLAGATDDRG